MTENETTPADDARRQAIRAKLFKLIKEELGAVDTLDEKGLHEDQRFVEDLAADSLDQVELLMRVEEEFVIEIMDEEAEKIKTVGEAIDFVVSKEEAQID